ncbi:hypothetical protein BaRGS_00003594 [Batillaria attramentaria]|uniref:BTB domain-containing protein n=1 Tax=Batillaria attramentaria TaxID=370345 RepID=A0ABD0LZB4_9CAEN
MASQITAVKTPCPFGTPDDTTDVIFLIEERKLYFNKAILMMCSPVFKSMFTANFKEKEAKEIELPEKKYDDVVAFFEQMHPVYSHQTPVTETSFGQILPLADEYQAEHVLHKCSEYLESQIHP